MSEVEIMIDSYYRFLRDRTDIKRINKDWTEITTPYLDRHNDYIQIYIKSINNGFVITDGGETLLDLEQSGMTITSQKRKEILQSILNGFGGITNEDGELKTSTTRDNFALRKHNLIQAILSVNDMFFLSSSLTTSLFFEDVTSWLDESDIRYSQRVKFSGKSGFDHMFDFLIPKSKHAPERIIKVINNPNRKSAENMIMSWQDTRDIRPETSEAYSVMNDNEKPIPNNVIDAFINYGIQPIEWSKRDIAKEKLAA